MGEPLATLRIDHRFRGPPRSGNGGYVCGRLAEFIDGDCRVRLLRPPPLEREPAALRSSSSLSLTATLIVLPRMSISITFTLINKHDCATRGRFR